MIRIQVRHREPDIPVLRGLPALAVRLRERAQRLGRDAGNERLRRNGLALRHERGLRHDAAGTDRTPKAEHRAHADAGLRAEIARMDDRPVTDGHTPGQQAALVRPAGMDDDAVFHRDLLLENDLGGIAADHGAGTDIAPRANRHIADKLGAGADKRRGIDARAFSMKRIEHDRISISDALEAKSDNVPPLFRRYVFVGKEVRL